MEGEGRDTRASTRVCISESEQVQGQGRDRAGAGRDRAGRGMESTLSTGRKGQGKGAKGAKEQVLTKTMKT